VTAPTKTVRRFDRELVPVTTVDAAQAASPDVAAFVNRIYAKIAEADRRKEEQEFELRVFGELFPPTTRERLFGKESK